MQPAKSEYSFQPAQATDEVAGRLSCPVQRCNAQSCPAVYRRTRWSQTVMNHLHAEHGYLQVAGFISDFMRCCYISLALIAPRATGKEQKRESSIYGNEYSRCRLWKESAFRYQIDFKLHCHRETSRVLRSCNFWCKRSGCWNAHLRGRPSIADAFIIRATGMLFGLLLREGSGTPQKERPQLMTV
ncbi:hypothetical protein MPTK1_7g08560 [Marchantia polymorpha subsp. ruderalis]|uniref:Uncharacterized protein n=2 Tax=Marchantia polymorpha TaxID=3197 RepID=A0AAF6BXG5_MARPO|nr:hypothetical protein MARPO_0068s0010 [Marchantia polymorpha]BBN16699.1 hypothetical protein Mp_7g08560 [Marchantia polymorpha subsp. ruderalis]|eukprot:PTQ35782.1 hypothetical protein MARPO_0068s0010 [Marchantia polymorpha]